MPRAVIDDDMIARMTAEVGADLRIDHSVNNEVASRIAVTEFAGGIGDVNPLWTDPEHAAYAWTSVVLGAPVGQASRRT